MTSVDTVPVTMKRLAPMFLKAVLVLIAVAAAAGLLWFPRTEGRAVGLSLVQIYSDPFILAVSVASMPFFIGLYQAWKLLRLIEVNRAFSQDAVTALRNIRWASFVLICCIAVGLMYIRFFAHGDDLAGPTALGMVAAFILAVIATAAAVFQKLLQNAVDMKSENDLTV